MLTPPVTPHRFGERDLGALTANDAPSAHARALHERGLRLAMLTSAQLAGTKSCKARSASRTA